MLLHEHPVNVERERAGRALANSLWFSGGGMLPPRPSPAPSIRTYAATGIAAALARFAGSPLQPLPSQLRDALSDAGSADSIVVALDRALDVPAIERAWAAPARARLPRARSGGDIALRRRRRCHRVARRTARALATPRRQLSRDTIFAALLDARGSGLVDGNRAPHCPAGLDSAGGRRREPGAGAGVRVARRSERGRARPRPCDVAGVRDDERHRGAPRRASPTRYSRREKIVIIADYDADGATACAVGMRGLAAMGAVVDFLVPNRFEYGYGLTPEIVAAAAAVAPRLIVTVDNGIASHDGVTAAAERGIEVLITDHHLPAATLPAPALIVNPNQPGCAFPGKHLAGVGVMFYVLARHPGRIARTAAISPVGRSPISDAARPRRPRHRGRRRVPRPDQPDAGRTGTRANPRRSRATRHPGAAGRRGSRSAPGDGLRPGLRRRSRPQCRGAAFRHGARHSLPPRRHRCVGGGTARRRELDRLNRERRDVESTMQEEALVAARSAGAGRRRRRCVHALPLPPRLASGRRRHRRGTAQGPVSPPDHRFRQRERRASSRVRGDRSPASICATPSTSQPKRAPGLLAKFGGHAYAAGLTISEAELPRFAAIFEAIAREAADIRRPRAHARLGRLARTGRARHRARQHPARAKSGARVSRPCSTTPFRCSPSASWVATTPSWRSPVAPNASTRSCFGMWTRSRPRSGRPIARTSTNGAARRRPSSSSSTGSRRNRAITCRRAGGALPRRTRNIPGRPNQRGMSDFSAFRPLL